MFRFESSPRKGKVSEAQIHPLPDWPASDKDLWCIRGCDKDLWCAIELFAFIQMGGTADRIVIRLIAEDPVIATRMLSFSVDTAECSFDSDRQMLLAVIESCFGQLSAFDKQMRRLVQERVV